MKKALIFLLMMFIVQAKAQTNPITSINISLPANPDANMANWGKGTSQFTITAIGKAVNGRVDGFVAESRILVIIKKNGGKICGVYTNSTAPIANFNTLTKVWSGSNAVSLIGQSIILPPGDYELSVQFFGYINAKFNPLSDEKTKAFTIRGSEQQSYQAPQAIAPTNETLIKESDLLKPITFRWTPIIPRPAEPVTYRLRVWQLMQGQNGTQARTVNQPVFTKDVDNLTQAIVNNLYTGPCKPPYLCNFVWNVQALNREGKPIGSNNGTSESFAFSFSSTDKKRPMITLLSPANGSSFAPLRPAEFKWKVNVAVGDFNGDGYYKIKIVEIFGDQSPEQAFRTNKPIFEKDSLNETLIYPSTAPELKSGKKYAWAIGSSNNWSTPSMFQVGTCDVNLSLKLISVECRPDFEGKKQYRIKFSSTYTSSTYNLTYFQSGSGFKAYHPSYSPTYSTSVITPSLQTQNSGASSTVNYSLAVSVPYGQTAIKLGLQGDDKDPGPITCKPGAELDITLPVCAVPICDCGKWGPLVLEGKKYECGSRINWSCKKPFQFTSSYQCSTTDKDCVAKTTWEVRKGETLIKSGTGANTMSDGVSLLANGTYTLTLNANCGDKKCPSCTYTIFVEDCKVVPVCDCGEWGSFNIKTETPTGSVNRSYKCGESLTWKCNQAFSFSSSYLCSQTVTKCQANTSWEIKKDGVVIKKGTGANSATDTFTPTSNGTYTLTLNANCGGKDCLPCKYTIVVNDCVATSTCDCGEWGLLKIIPFYTTINNTPKAKLPPPVTYKCGSKIEWKCNQVLSFSTTYKCNTTNARCIAKTSWEIKKDNVLIKSGNGLNNSTDTFKPTENGTYTLTLNANCGGKDCQPCTYTFRVDDCQPALSCVTPPRGMVAWWTFDEKAGQPLVDRAGVDNAGTGINNPLSLPAKVAGGLKFNGTNYVTVPNHVELNFGTGDFSFDAWIQTTDDIDLKALVDKRSQQGTQKGYLFYLIDGKIAFLITDGTTTNYNTSLYVADGKWHHIAITVDRKNKKGIIFYVDGVPTQFGDPTLQPGNIDNISKLQIGKDLYSNSYNFKGILDEIELFNRVVTKEEIVSIFKADKAGKCKDVAPTCDCGEWGLLKIIPFYTTINNTPKAKLPPPVTYKCGSKIEWKCNQVLSFSTTYKCNTTDARCIAKTSWEIKKDNVLIKSGNGLSNSTDTFKPTENGTYTLTLNANCGGKDCQPCTYTFRVDDCQPALSCVTPPRGMVAWWTFDEKAGQPLVDRAGVDNAGTGINNPLSLPAKVAGGLKFNGINNYVTVPNHAEINFGTGDLSFDAWIQTGDAISIKTIIDKRSIDVGYAFFLYKGKLSLQLNDSGPNTNYVSPLFVADGRWHHIAITVDRKNKKGILFYLDGVPTQYGDPTLRPGNLDNTEPLLIARNANDEDNNGNKIHFKGILDEIELFKRVLTKDEVVSIFKADKAGKCKTDIPPVESTTCNCTDSPWDAMQKVKYNDGSKTVGQEINYLDKSDRKVKTGSVITYYAPEYRCTTENCKATYNWKIINLKNGTVYSSGTTISFPIDFTAPKVSSDYKFEVVPVCGTTICKPCGFNFTTAP